jgi:hypothetical protein
MKKFSREDLDLMAVPWCLMKFLLIWMLYLQKRLVLWMNLKGVIGRSRILNS